MLYIFTLCIFISTLYNRFFRKESQSRILDVMMGYWWYCVSGFVHVNAILLLIALLPFPPPQFWQAVLGCRIFFVFPFIREHLWALYSIMGIPCLIMFIDSWREFLKYAAVEYSLYSDALTRKEARMNLALAQRNYHIAGAAIVICFIVPRLISVLEENAELSVKTDTVVKALKVFRQLVGIMEAPADPDDDDDYGGARQDDSAVVTKVLVQSIKRELEKLAKEGKLAEDLRMERKELEELVREYERKRAAGGARPDFRTPRRAYRPQDSYECPRSDRPPPRRRTPFGLPPHNFERYEYT